MSKITFLILKTSIKLKKTLNTIKPDFIFHLAAQQ